MIVLWLDLVQQKSETPIQEGRNPNTAQYQRSAELHSPVSRICNRQSFEPPSTCLH